MAADSGVVAAFRLSPAVFHCAIQDFEARPRRPQVRLGQTGTHRRGELCSGSKSREGQHPLASRESFRFKTCRPERSVCSREAKANAESKDLYWHRTATGTEGVLYLLSGVV